MNYDDPTWRLVDVYVWTTLENSVGITSACLPTMREYKTHLFIGSYNAEANQGPLFGRLFPGASRAEASSKKDSRSGSQRAAKAQFNRLFEESGPGIESQELTNKGDHAWTSPDLAASNELFSMDKTSTRPLDPVFPGVQRERIEYLARNTPRANYE